jgi:hypothetical protein
MASQDPRGTRGYRANDAIRPTGPRVIAITTAIARYNRHGADTASARHDAYIAIVQSRNGTHSKE